MKCAMCSAEHKGEKRVLERQRVLGRPSLQSLEALGNERGDFACCSVIDEPGEGSCRGLDTSCRQILLGSWIQDLLEDVLFACASRDKRHMMRMIEDWECKSDSLRWRLWRIGNGSAPNRGLVQQLVSREQGASVAIGSHAQQDQVKDGVAHGIPSGECFGQLRDVILCGIFWRQGSIDWVDVLLWDVDMVEELVFGKKVVRVFVVERHTAFICKVDNPLGKVNGGVVSENSA